MAENSAIEWTTHTFNAWTGCTKVSPACDHCYAEGWAKRSGLVEWGPHAPRRRTSAANWKKPEKWNREAQASGTRPRVFCSSLADVFDNHKSIDPQWRLDLWRLIWETPNLDWLLLTKRPQNISKMLPYDGGMYDWGQDGWPNVWLGTTVENQIEADRRIPHLLAVPAAVHFISMEPLLGHVDLTGWLWGLDEPCSGCPMDADCECAIEFRSDLRPRNSINWVITGGESGPQYRHADPDWFRSLRDQCAAAGVPFLFKQWEGRSQKEIKARGRALDGVVHDGYPNVTLSTQNAEGV